MDFLMDDVVAEVCKKHNFDQTKALMALLSAVVDDHMIIRHEDDPTKPRRGTVLQGLDVIIYNQYIRNVDISERYTRDDEPDDGRYVTGLVRGDIADQQEIALEIVRECMRQADTPEENPDAEPKAGAMEAEKEARLMAAKTKLAAAVASTLMHA